MPRVIQVEGVPLIVQHAIEILGSSVKVELIRYYRRNPGHSQSDAARALQAPRASIGRLARALAERGVLIEQPAEDNRSANTYRVDERQLRYIISAFSDYLLDDDDPAAEQ